MNFVLDVIIVLSGVIMLVGCVALLDLVLLGGYFVNKLRGKLNITPMEL